MALRTSDVQSRAGLRRDTKRPGFMSPVASDSLSKPLSAINAENRSRFMTGASKMFQPIVPNREAYVNTKGNFFSIGGSLFSVPDDRRGKNFPVEKQAIVSTVVPKDSVPSDDRGTIQKNAAIFAETNKERAETAPDSPPSKVKVGRQVFNPFRVPIWKKSAGEVIGRLSDPGGVGSLTIPVGTYLFTVKGDVLDHIPTIGMEMTMPFAVSGKRMILEKFDIDKGQKIGRFQVKVVENPIPVLALWAGTLVAGGFAAWKLEGSLVQVDKIFDKAIPVAIGIVGVLAAWYFFIRRKV